MARTRGAMLIAERDRERHVPGATHGETVMLEPEVDMPAPEPRVLPPAPVYTCDPTTLDRNLEASELADILARVLGGWSITIGAEEWSALRPDVRRHFKRTLPPSPQTSTVATAGESSPPE